MTRSISLFLAATAVTVLLVLGIARLPGGERMMIALDNTAEQWFAEPFEVTLVNELNAVREPEMRPMMLQLVMLHIAKEARLARLQVVGGSRSRGWQIPLPSYALQANQALNSIPTNIRAITNSPASAIAPTEPAFNGWAALGLFGLAICWLTLRQR